MYLGFHFFTPLSSDCLCSLEECGKGGGRRLRNKRVPSLAQQNANCPGEKQP